MNKKNITALVFVIVISFVFGVSSSVFAAEDYNSSRSNTSTSIAGDPIPGVDKSLAEDHNSSRSNLSNIKINNERGTLQKDKKSGSKGIRSFFNKLVPVKRENIRKDKLRETNKIDRTNRIEKNILDKKRSSAGIKRLDKLHKERTGNDRDLIGKKRELEKRLHDAKTPEEREAIKREIGEKRDSLRDKIGDKRAGLKDRRDKRREEIKKKLGERAKKRIGAYIDRIAKRFSAVLDRFEKIGHRIDTRISKLEDSGVDVSAMRGAQANAKEKILIARDNVKQVINLARVATQSENPRESFGKTRELIIEAKDSIKEVHKALIEVIKEIKASSKIRSEKDKTQESNTTTKETTNSQ